ncbi:MAG TPA: hypothetical protein VFC56_05945 [Stellaceae bacterium]|nr:hypothetical protein [Stellaceae bacterium]
MKSKPDTPQTDPDQSKRFVDMARELGPDESGEKFGRAFKTVTRATERAATKGRRPKQKA